MDGEGRECVCEDDKDNTNQDQVICHDDRKQGNGIDFYNSLSMPCDPVEINHLYSTRWRRKRVLVW